MPARTPEEIQPLLAAAFNAGDIDAFLDLHEDDATVIPPGGARAAGRAEIRAAVAPTFALRPTIRNEVLDSLHGDGVALVHARWHLRGDDAGREVELSGVATVVSRRQTDGSWRIVLEDTMRTDPPALTA
jgi:uncharacterized protein (TIGR02246 family)